jgi:hypothetical protein
MQIEPGTLSKLLDPDNYENRGFKPETAALLDEAGYRPLLTPTFVALADALDEARKRARPFKRLTAGRYVLASPMASSGDYAADRSVARDFAHLLHEYCGADVYYAGETVGTPADFDSESLAFQVNLAILQAACRFVLLLTEPVVKPTSVWVEAGLALALRIPSTYILENREWLPYILKRAHEEGTVQVELGGLDEARRLIRLHNSRYFTAPA